MTLTAVYKIVNDAPKTGDITRRVLWIGLAVLFAGGLGTLTVVQNRKKRQN